MLPIIAADESNRALQKSRSNRRRLLRQHRCARASLYAYDQSPAYIEKALFGCKRSLHVIASFAVEIVVIISPHYVLSRKNEERVC